MTALDFTRSERIHLPMRAAEHVFFGCPII